MNNTISISCPHCLTTNNVPVARENEHPKCGRCHKALYEGEPVQLNEHWLNVFLEKNDSPLLIDFWAPWCGPCLKMEPAFAEAATQLEPKVRLCRLNTEQNQLVSKQFNIRSIPTIILFEKRRELARRTGVLSTNEIVSWVNQHTTV